MTKNQHIHKLKRLTYKSGNAVFFCALPDCSYKTNIALALGKRSICWRCGEPFVMSEYDLRLSKPHCDNCHKPKHDVPYHNQDATTELWDEVTKRELSLAERLEQTIHQAQKQEEDEI